jgi:pimeloyl-ACP methyl ester carboxylesterase
MTTTSLDVETVSLQTCLADSAAVLAMPDLTTTETEDIFRVDAAGLKWTIGVRVYEPAEVAVGADGKRIGAFFLHGGQDDWRQMEPWARMMSRKFGWKVVVGTFPGRLYLPDPSRNWPGDTIRPDGSVRTPIWLDGEFITPDQYEVRTDTSMRMRYGTRTVVHARPGTMFYHRMAAWPVAMEVGMSEALRRHFPAGEYSIYLQGHSTGGPMVCMLAQRVPNVTGILAAENSPFGYISQQQHAWSGSLGKVEGFDRVRTTAAPRQDPFYELYIRSWRDLARYRGPEALGIQGPAALMQLPALMEDIFDEWHQQLIRPLFKCEYPITHNIEDSLRAAASVTADRLGLDETGRAAMLERYLGYPRELRGEGVKPVPPVLFGISRNSRDHSREVYTEVIMPMFRRMSPAPRIALQHFQAGVHKLWSSQPDLPYGIMPAVSRSWDTAVKSGYFTSS